MKNIKDIVKFSRKTFIGLFLLHLITTFIWVMMYDSKNNFTNGMIIFSIILGDIIVYILHYIFFIKMESSVTKEEKEQYVKGILINNIVIIIIIQLLLIVLSNYQIMLINNRMSSKMDVLIILFISTFIKLFACILYYLFTNNKKAKENRFIFIPFTLQVILFMILFIFGEEVIQTTIIQAIILVISNYFILRNRKKLSKKYNIQENKLCKRFYLIFLLSYIPLTVVMLTLDELDLILSCSGMFCGLGTAISLIMTMPLLEIIISIICMCVAKAIK